MVRKLFLQLRRYPKLALALTLLSGFSALNIVAYNNAYTMMNYSPQGERTEPPEVLTGLRKIGTLIMGVNVPRPFNDILPSDIGLLFEAHTLKVSDGIELEAWYVPHPESRGIILMFHGYATSKSSLLPEADAFHEMKYSIFLVDFRGSGGSSGMSTSLGFHEASDVAAAIMYVRTLSPGQPLILYGQSMGSVAILRAIYEHGLQPDAIIIEGVFDKMLSTVQNQFSAMGVPSFPSAHLLVFWGGVQNGFSGFRHNPVEYAARVQSPVLMIHGTEDPRVSIDQAKAVFDNFVGEKRFIQLPGVGHESYAVADPEEWNQTISQFLIRYVIEDSF